MEHGPVVVRFPAETGYLRLARLACAAFATEHGFDVDDLDDVRIAVDELCSLLVGVSGAEPDSVGEIELRCSLRDGDLVVDGRLEGGDGQVATPDGLVHDILEATTDEVEMPGPGQPAFRFRRRSQAAAPDGAEPRG